MKGLYKIGLMFSESGIAPDSGMHVNWIDIDVEDEPTWFYSLNVSHGFNFALASGPFVASRSRHVS